MLSRMLVAVMIIPAAFSWSTTPRFLGRSALRLSVTVGEKEMFQSAPGVRLEKPLGIVLESREGDLPGAKVRQLKVRPTLLEGYH